MRKIAIIGSGQAGLLAAHGLRKAGYPVTLYSDRTPQAWLTDSRPTGTAGRFHPALDYERELGLAYWHAQAPGFEGAHMTLVPVLGNRLLTMTSRLSRPGMAIDLRLQSHRWMVDLTERGGKVEIEQVSVARLEEIAREHDLTFVATGKGGLASLFPRDQHRSLYSKPQRQLAMVCVKGPSLRLTGIPLTPFKFNLLQPLGEAFWIPYYHKDAGRSWNCLFEAKTGTALDRFGNARSGKEVLDIARGAIKELAPWDYPWFKDAELSDENGWLVGAVSPEVRRPAGRLPSGQVVMALGDTAMAMDPVAGQGANNGSRMARWFVDAVLQRGGEPFDEAWMTATFDGFYERHGRWANEWTRFLLEPPSPMAKALMVAQYGSDGRKGRSDGVQRLANIFAENFTDPSLYTAMFQDEAKIRGLIRDKLGSFTLALARNVPGVLRGQLRQRLGKDPGHPAAEAPAA